MSKPKPNEDRQIRIDVEEMSASFRTVNRWLDANEKYLRQPPPEHYIMTELNDQRFVERNRRRQPARPNRVPTPILPSLIKYPKEPAYSKPQWTYYKTIDVDAVGNNSRAGSSRTTYVMKDQKLSIPTCTEIEMKALGLRRNSDSPKKEDDESSNDGVVYYF